MNLTIVTTLNHFINNGLMALFFLLVTLEVKSECIVGDLNSLTKASLPMIAAVGGMCVPAAIFWLFNFHSIDAMRGWAIPTATDIAFSLAILIFLSRHVPSSLKVFLAALAIFDDLGAIIIIAIFYTQQLSGLYLFLAGMTFGLLLFLNYIGIVRLLPYLVVGFLLWFLILKSGIHSTVAGVLLGLCIPLTDAKSNASPLKKIQHVLSPWTAFGVLPIFALANTGIRFSEITSFHLFHPITLGIFFGLFLGKQLGVFLFCLIAVKSRLAEFPKNITLRHLYGVSVLCGIGFTMSLFIGDLAFVGNKFYGNLVKVGVLGASLLSAITAGLLLYSKFFVKNSHRRGPSL